MHSLKSSDIVFSNLLLIGIFIVSVALFLIDGRWIQLQSLLLGINFFILFKLYFQSKIKTLSFIFCFVSMLPFIHLIFYFNFNFDKSYSILWGLAANKYMYDKNLISILLNIANIWSSVALLSSQTKDLYIENIKVNNIVLRKEIFWFFALFATFIAWISAPSETLFQSAYMGSSANLEINVSSLWTLGYILVVAIFISASEKFQNYKLLVYVLIAYITVYLGLLRGDRESLTLIVALLFFSYIYKKSLYHKKIIKPNGRLILSLLVIVIVINGVIGGLRSSIIDETTELASFYNDFQVSNLLHGTWSAVLLTPLSVVYDLHVVNSDYRLGADYVDLILSLPPGFFSEAIGYDRPWSSTGGPATEMVFGLGGTHITVLPFRNFGIYGVIFYAIFLSRAIKLVEIRAHSNPSIFMMTIYISLFMIIPHWLWYGEKYVVNHLIFLILLYPVFKIYEKNKLNSRYTNNS
jgi:hypothetical protein